MLQQFYIFNLILWSCRFVLVTKKSKCRVLQVGVGFFLYHCNAAAMSAVVLDLLRVVSVPVYPFF